MIYFLCLVLFCIGLYCVVTKHNVIKIIIGVAIMEYAINLFFILSGFVLRGRAPIYDANQKILNMVDPLPQNIVLITIVIGLGILALLAAMAMRLYEKYKTFDITKMRKLRG